MRPEKKTCSSLQKGAEKRMLGGHLVIRRFLPGDMAPALDIDADVYGGYDPSIFITFYEYHPSTTLVAELQGAVVGFLLGFKHTALEGRIFWLAVSPGHQNRGVATRLLLEELKIFRQMGAVSATLEVRIGNKKAQSLYSALGFEIVGICPCYYSNGEAAIVMKRRL
jgi:ribosomal-protein-alanine N-acetyltransferase